MANEIRIRRNNIAGTITDNPLTNVATTINSPGFVDLPTIDATSHLLLILDPLELAGPAEIVRVTTHTAASSTCTIVRGAEGSAARTHSSGTTWFHGPVTTDYLEILTSGSRPAIPYTGQSIYETDTGYYKDYSGTAWEDGHRVGQWSNWPVAPVITQGVNVTYTNNQARYTKVGRQVTAIFVGQVTGAGSAATDVSVSIPFLAATFSANPFGTVGVGGIFDTSAGSFFKGTAIIVAGNQVRFRATSSTGAGTLGSETFTAALAAGDTLDFTITYEATT